MLAKLTQTAVLAASLIHLAAATRTIPVVPPTSLQFCNSVVESSSPQIQSLFTALDVDLGGAVAPVGLDCSPIAAVQNCGAMPVLCDEPDAELGEIILINCLPPSL
ncbi:hypothetical protein C8F01DRAFT_1160213 [Mycena amicta]|nr:hypothetical protein C8F01DRAFT_1160213 [Mycena amicta]